MPMYVYVCICVCMCIYIYAWGMPMSMCNCSHTWVRSASGIIPQAPEKCFIDLDLHHRLASWLASPREPPYLCLPPAITGVTSARHHTWLSALVLRTQTEVLTLVRQALDWPSHPLSPPSVLTYTFLHASLGRIFVPRIHGINLATYFFFLYIKFFFEHFSENS